MARPAAPTVMTDHDPVLLVFKTYANHLETLIMMELTQMSTHYTVTVSPPILLPLQGFVQKRRHRVILPHPLQSVRLDVFGRHIDSRARDAVVPPALLSPTTPADATAAIIAVITASEGGEAAIRDAAHFPLSPHDTATATTTAAASAAVVVLVITVAVACVSRRPCSSASLPPTTMQPGRRR